MNLSLREARQPLISVIIPTFNEALNLQATISSTRSAGTCEIIVVDGGSFDETVQCAQGADQVLTSPPGRAIQQNMGADQAQGEILLFLHADCELSPGFDEPVRSALLKANVIAGCFQQQIDHPGRVYRVLESGNSWRVRNLGWIYGDQGLFLKRETFQRLGGFPETPLMEDLYFSKRLRRQGKLVVLDHRLKVSARRWEKNGVLRQTARNWTFVTLSHLGCSPKTLAYWYGHVREPDLKAPLTH